MESIRLEWYKRVTLSEVTRSHPVVDIIQWCGVGVHYCVLSTYVCKRVHSSFMHSICMRVMCTVSRSTEAGSLLVQGVQCPSLTLRCTCKYSRPGPHRLSLPSLTSCCSHCWSCSEVWLCVHCITLRCSCRCFIFFYFGSHWYQCCPMAPGCPCWVLRCLFLKCWCCSIITIPQFIDSRYILGK